MASARTRRVVRSIAGIVSRCATNARSTSKPMLDRGADLHVRRLGSIIGPAIGLMRAIEELKSKVELRQHAERTHSGNANLGSSVLSYVQVRRFQVEAGHVQFRR